jgi:hypothetical protein
LIIRPGHNVRINNPATLFIMYGRSEPSSKGSAGDLAARIHHQQGDLMVRLESL